MRAAIAVQAARSARRRSLGLTPCTSTVDGSSAPPTNADGPGVAGAGATPTRGRYRACGAVCAAATALARGGDARPGVCRKLW
jgi:hypothetical protein